MPHLDSLCLLAPSVCSLNRRVKLHRRPETRPSPPLSAPYRPLVLPLRNDRGSRRLFETTLPHVPPSPHHLAPPDPPSARHLTQTSARQRSAPEGKGLVAQQAHHERIRWNSRSSLRRRDNRPVAPTGQTSSRVTLLGKSKTRGKAVVHTTLEGQRERIHFSGDTHSHGVRD